MIITDKYVFFWGGIYSQWHKVPFRINGVWFNCAEQYMMWRKATMFGDIDTAELIIKASDPKKQKALGRLVKGFDANIWNKNARMIVYQGNYAKFSQNETLFNEMMTTGDRMFVEASPYDNIWGIGMAEDDEGVEDPANWKGTNWLGQVLTKVRTEFLDKDVVPES